MVNGIINVYKEKGFTSFDVVAKMRGIYHQKKIGHTGTLDPDAEGVLPVCLGKATKVCDMLTDRDKEYRAVMLLGVTTDTQDITGEVLKESLVEASEEEVRQAVMKFVGKIDQIPPMYSALKVNGQKLCDLARAGVTVERKARPIEIYSIVIEDINLPEVTMTVRCSKGTYIRTLCNDIGEALGCGACMKSLLRTNAAGFSLADSHKLSELEKAPFMDIIPIDKVFDSYPKINSTEPALKLVENGNMLPAEFVSTDILPEADKKYRLYDHNERFIGVYTYMSETDDYKPVKIFMD